MLEYKSEACDIVRKLEIQKKNKEKAENIRNKAKRNVTHRTYRVIKKQEI